MSNLTKTTRHKPDCNLAERFSVIVIATFVLAIALQPAASACNALHA